MIRAYATKEANGKFEVIEYDPGALKADDVEIEVESCGLCHSDLSLVDDEWGVTQFPIVPGHEVIGRIVETGPAVTHLQTGDRVGVGWFSRSCLTCTPCMSGDHNMCPSVEQIAVGRPGGFGERVRVQASWANRLPDSLDPKKAGPLFCGGITVFNPLVQFGVRPTDKVGVIGIGGLGHLALQFLRAWGCEVTAFTSSLNKQDEAKRLGAHKVVDKARGYQTDVRALNWLKRFGAKACLLSWLPVVGDPLCAVAGLLKLPFWPCLAYMAVGKFFRYLFMTSVLLYFMPGQMAV